MICHFNFCAKVINTIVIILCFGFVNTDLNSTKSEKTVLCSKTDYHSCKCVHFTDQMTELTSVNVDCSGADIKSLKPDVIVPKLTSSLDLSFNLITTISSDQMWISFSVTTLYLNYNQISTIEGNTFKNLPNLKYLDLSNNLLGSIKYDAFKSLHKLTVLNLENNMIGSFEKHAFKPLQSLNELRLSYNKLGDFFNNDSNVFEPGGLYLNQNLSIFNVASNNISEFPKNFFKAAYNLREIVLSNNNFEHLPKLPFTVEYLDISSTQIFNISPKQFSNLPAITTLVMNDLQNLTHIENHTFEAMKNLQVLKIEHCKNLHRFHTTAFGMEALEKNYEFTLKKISFFGSGLKTLEENLYPLFARLSDLDLRGNPWNCDCRLNWILQLNIKKGDEEFVR